MVNFIVVLIVTTISLLIIARIPALGVEIDSTGTAVVAALVFGILNALVKPVLTFLSLPLIFITFGIFFLIINAIIFAIAAWLIDGFRLRNGFVSAIIGSIILSILNTIILAIVQ